ncbi:MAG: SH3 domain-containing protein, partial [Pseudomonadota bacterium]
METLGLKLRKLSAINFLIYLFIISFFLSTLGCQEIDTIKKELIVKVETKLLKKKTQFVPREGITLRPTSLYQTANLNSEIIRKLPAETPLNLLDKVGEMFKVRTRDGREGYVEQKSVGGDDIIAKTHELRKSIEGIPPQAEAVTKSKANFRLVPGRQNEIIEVLPPGKKLEIYERVVTLRSNQPSERTSARMRSGDPTVVPADEPSTPEEGSDDVRKDVWYKVKIEDG